MNKVAKQCISPEEPEKQLDVLMSAYENTGQKSIEYIQSVYMQYLSHLIYPELKNTLLEQLDFLLSQEEVNKTQIIEQKEFIKLLQENGIDIEKHDSKGEFNTYLLEQLSSYNLDKLSLYKQFIEANVTVSLLKESCESHKYSIDIDETNTYLKIVNNARNIPIYQTNITNIFSDIFL